MAAPVQKNQALFATMPIPQAVRQMAVPAVISQIIVLLYNLADTFFIGKTNDPYMVAGVSLILPVFNITMALGTLMGGRRIIDTVGREMTAPGPREGLAADLGCGACLLGATLLGLPVSTTHVRTAALLGVCRAGGNRVERGVAGRIFWAWGLTFPGCAAIGYWMAKVFLPLFS